MQNPKRRVFTTSVPPRTLPDLWYLSVRDGKLVPLSKKMCLNDCVVEALWKDTGYIFTSYKIIAVNEDSVLAEQIYDSECNVTLQNSTGGKQKEGVDYMKEKIQAFHDDLNNQPAEHLIGVNRIFNTKPKHPILNFENIVVFSKGHASKVSRIKIEAERSNSLTSEFDCIDIEVGMLIAIKEGNETSCKFVQLADTLSNTYILRHVDKEFLLKYFRASEIFRKIDSALFSQAGFIKRIQFESA